MSTGPAEARAALAEAYRGEWGAVFGTIVRLTGDWELAEDCAQEAFARALPAWEREGVPQKPGAWLVTAARHRAFDTLRRGTAERSKMAEVAALKAAGIPYRVPPPGARAERLDGVLAVIYLMFTEGYAPSDGNTQRDSLAEEAVRLARLVAAEAPDEPEARGCSHCCCSSIRGAPPGSTPTAGWSRWTGRTARGGTTHSSQRARPSRARPSRRAAPTPSVRPSPRSTPSLRPRPRPTGRRS